MSQYNNKNLLRRLERFRDLLGNESEKKVFDGFSYEFPISNEFIRKRNVPKSIFELEKPRKGTVHIEQIELLAVMLASGELPLDDFVAADDKTLKRLATENHINEDSLLLLHKQLSVAGMRTTRPLVQRTRIQVYRDLLKARYRTPLDVVQAGQLKLDLDIGLGTSGWKEIHLGALDSAKGPNLVKVFDVPLKSDPLRHLAACCGPPEALAWKQRYDYYSDNSRLSIILKSVKDKIDAQIQQVREDIRDESELFDRYGLWDIPGSTKDLKTLSTNVTSQEEMLGTLKAVRNRIIQIKEDMEICLLEATICTGKSEDKLNPFARGGGDGNKVTLSIIGKNDSGTDITPLSRPVIGPWTYFLDPYGDGGEAVYLDTSLNLKLYDIDKFRLSYASTNDWNVRKISVIVGYKENSLIDKILHSDQNREFDLVLLEESIGWVFNNDVLEFPDRSPEDNTCPFRSQSTAYRVMSEVKEIERILTRIEDRISYVKSDNPLFKNFGTLKWRLRKGAKQLLAEEFGLARLQYIKILDLLSDLLEKPNITSDQSEILFAVHILIADTYLGQGALAFAYDYLNRAYQYKTRDDEAFLWMKLGELFLHWGDQVYAGAGSDYPARLAAISKYQRLSKAALVLSYPDGCEDAIERLWLDLGYIKDLSEARGKDLAKKLRVALYRGAVTGSTLDNFAVVDSILPLRKVEIVSDQYPNGKPRTGSILRIELDVSDQGLNREALMLVAAMPISKEDEWKPTWARVHVAYETLLPHSAREKNSYRGVDKNIADQAVGLKYLEVELTADKLDWVLWPIDLSGLVTLGRRRLSVPPGCEAGFLVERARLRIDQVQSHLNLLGVHDEYVPVHRFNFLYQHARQLAERATVLEQRYIQFKDRAETEALNLMDARNIIESSEMVKSIAAERLAQAEMSLQGNNSQIGAAQTEVSDADRALNMLDDTYVSGRMAGFLNSVNLSLGGPSFSPGGVVTAITGMGYDEQFYLQRQLLVAQTHRAKAALSQLEFNKSLAETELLVAQTNFELETLRYNYASERMAFLELREMNVSVWIEIAKFYRSLLEEVVKNANRYAWFAEQALEFEINTRIDLIRMDYHHISSKSAHGMEASTGGSELGSERLLTDIDALHERLIEFREHFRDVPNIIEREFRLSQEFHEQFRTLTSTESPPAMPKVARGLRRAGFSTTMEAYDRKIPGRYAYGRIAAVEVEIQGDVAPGTVTGYLENARLVPSEDVGSPKCQQRVSTSLVRVPRPIPDPVEITCEPQLGLNSSVPEDPYATKFFDELGTDVLPELQGRQPEPFEVMFSNKNIMQNVAFDNVAFDTVFAEGIAEWIYLNSGQSRSLFKPKDVPQIEPTVEAAKLVEEAVSAGFTSGEFNTAIRAALGPNVETSINRFNAYAKHRNLDFQLSPENFTSAKELSELVPEITKQDLHKALIKQFEPKPRHGYARFRYGWLSEQNPVYYKDLTLRYSDDPEKFTYIPDDIDYSNHSREYVLRVKVHESQSLSLSTYDRREDAIVFNPFSSSQMLGLFENCGIHSDWTLTLKAFTDARPKGQPVYDKIREIILRVWYHAAYERMEGPCLADTIEDQVMRRQDLSVAISFYRDFYDEFVTLVGDFNGTDPHAAEAVRGYTDDTHVTTNGWIGFSLDETLIAFDSHKIEALFLVVVPSDQNISPDFVWQLRKGETGPEYQGNTRNIRLGDVMTDMSHSPPKGFKGLDPRGRWYFRLAESDGNEGKDLSFIQDIELYIEYKV